VSWLLVSGIAGLALLDSVNPATLVAVALILTASRKRPIAETLGFVSGAFLSVLLVGTAIYLGADAAAGAIGEGLTWLRRLAFGAAAMTLAVAAAGALRPRATKPVALPPWFNSRSAIGLGVVMTGADLPQALPYFMAIERLLAAQVPTSHALLVLVGYSLIYCVPCVVLLAIGLQAGNVVTDRLGALHDRFGAAATLPRQPRKAAALAAAALLLAGIAAA
jgi:hypothetical protein